jgi:hypothetical protein
MWPKILFEKSPQTLSLQYFSVVNFVSVLRPVYEKYFSETQDVLHKMIKFTFHLHTTSQFRIKKILQNINEVQRTIKYGFMNSDPSS